jgi:hypothetical protein
MIALLILIVWRGVFARLNRSSLANEILGAQQRHNNLLLQVGLAVTTASRFENDLDIPGRLDPKEHAAACNLQRIVALTGAKQAGDAYVLDVGKARFSVRYRSVQRDVIVPTHRHWETCFYPAGRDMPRSEQIAMALLQLKNNPALFDKWASHRDLMFKADGQAFTHKQ